MHAKDATLKPGSFLERLIRYRLVDCTLSVVLWELRFFYWCLCLKTVYS